MINYYILQHEQSAKTISEECFKLTRPTSNPDDVTKYLFSWLKHPAQELYALEVDDTTIMPLSSQADCDAAFAVMSDLTDEEKGIVRAKVQNGETVMINDIIPALTRQKFKTREQMEIDGWFGESINN